MIKRLLFMLLRRDDPMTNPKSAKDTPEQSPEFDQRDFRNALGHFGTGVTVITTKDASGQMYGVTVSSFNSVSLSPPLVLWSQVRGAPSHQAFVDSPYFIVNILSESQKDISNHFAKPSEDKFKDIAHHLSPEGAHAVADRALEPTPPRTTTGPLRGAHLSATARCRAAAHSGGESCSIAPKHPDETSSS
jgi:hypothetical protein